MTVILLIAQIYPDTNTFVDYISVKGLSQPASPLPQKSSFSSSSFTNISSEFWEELAEQTEASHILISTNDPNFTIKQLAKGKEPKREFIYSIVPTSLLIAYGCNQGQLLTVQLFKKDNSLKIDLIPVVDYQVQTSTGVSFEYNSVKEIKEQDSLEEHLAALIWECALDTGREHLNRAALLLENISLVKYHDSIPLNEVQLRERLEKRLPVSAFAGDNQPKKIGFRATPSFHGPIPSEMIPFFGGLIAGRSIFTFDPLYKKISSSN
jgi:hypothetical protein